MFLVFLESYKNSIPLCLWSRSGKKTEKPHCGPKRKSRKHRSQFTNAPLPIHQMHRSQFNMLANFPWKVFAIFNISFKILMIFTIFIEFCTDFDENFLGLSPKSGENVDDSSNFLIFRDENNYKFKFVIT